MQWLRLLPATVLPLALLGFCGIIGAYQLAQA